MKRKHWLLIILDWLFIGVTICSSISLLFMLIARYVSPEQLTFFAFFALGAPIIYLVNIIVLAIWVARWRGWALLPLMLMFWGIWDIGKFIQVDFDKNYIAVAHQPSSKDIGIVTFNIHSFNDGQSIEQISNYVASYSPDVICFQEFETRDSLSYRKVDSLLFKWPYRAYTYYNEAKFACLGQAVFSKIPISNQTNIIFPNTNNSAMFVDVYWPSDTIRLFNCHLQTTAFNSINNEQGIRAMMDDKDAPKMARSAVGRLRYNFKIRAGQADSIAHLSSLSPYTVVITGDFNSPPMTYTYHTVRGDLADAFCKKGSGYGYTYRPMSGLFRIDFMLFDDKNLECLSYNSPNQQWSDHNPVFVKLKSTK